MSFSALKAETRRLAFEKGGCVDINTAAMLRIYESEGLEQHADLQQLSYNVRSFLSDWIMENINGHWSLERELLMKAGANSEDILRFHFSKKSEAVRFKLTWGGE